MESPIIEMPRVKDLDEFNRLNEDKVNTQEIPDTDKRYVMFVEKKRSLKLPLTFQEQKIINILA